MQRSTNPRALPHIHCSYDSGYQTIYEPGYEYIFIFYDEEDFEDEVWNDYVPLPATSNFTNRQIRQEVFQVIIAKA